MKKVLNDLESTLQVPCEILNYGIGSANFQLFTYVYEILIHCESGIITLFIKHTGYNTYYSFQ